MIKIKTKVKLFAPADVILPYISFNFSLRKFLCIVTLDYYYTLLTKVLLPTLHTSISPYPTIIYEPEYIKQSIYIYPFSFALLATLSLPLIKGDSVSTKSFDFKRIPSTFIISPASTSRISPTTNEEDFMY
jgi:hypothetical protein